MRAATHILSHTDSHAHTCAHRADCKMLMSKAAAFFSETRRLLCRTREAWDIGLSLAKGKEGERNEDSVVLWWWEGELLVTTP